MEDVVDNVNNELVEQDESTGSIPSQLFCTTRPNKRLRSKVWDDFIPTFIDGRSCGLNACTATGPSTITAPMELPACANTRASAALGLRRGQGSTSKHPLQSTKKSTAVVSWSKIVVIVSTSKDRHVYKDIWCVASFFLFRYAFFLGLHQPLCDLGDAFELLWWFCGGANIWLSPMSHYEMHPQFTWTLQTLMEGRVNIAEKC